MFSSALKSFTSNITSNYTLAPQPSSTSGPWKIFDAKRKTTGKAASVFVFDKRSLEPQSAGNSLSGKTSSGSLRRAQEEVIERLKKEASSLARLRHPSILELQEPVEETRNGGLMFATEAVTASLGSLLVEMDERKQAGSTTTGERRSRFVVEEADGSRELEIDELEIQKGLLQIGKGLEFLHESAGLVHANLTPEAILVNAKGDWKISGLSFCGPHATSTAATSLAPISLSEVLNHDPRLPRSVQMNLDYTSPDFVLDNSLTCAADMFSLGLLIIALYNTPHSSPLSTGGSISSYKRLFGSSSSIPTQNNNFLVPTTSTALPPKLVSELLPRLITRRPAQRLSAREFQEQSYFDNILVSTIRFLDALPAKSAGEKAAFMRGLSRIMPQFPKNVLEKKVLPALLEEMKDKELLAPIVGNLFAAVKIMAEGRGKKCFTEMVVPRLREVFVPPKGVSGGAAGERDTAREAGIMVLLENMSSAAQFSAGKEFREDILPILLLALESPTHGVVDAALGTLGSVLPALDFSTIKNELFPVIAGVFARTSSLNIKVKGLDAFYILCGGTGTTGGGEGNDDMMNGFGTMESQKTTASSSSTNSSAILDKFTIQEKIVPLLKGIKTKEPGVMMAALRVFRQVGDVADSDYLAMEVLPVLWSMSLGPLLNLQQFKGFMDLIKKLGERIEREQTKKLQELRSGDSVGVGVKQGGGRIGAAGVNGAVNGGEEADFESLVSGRKAAAGGGIGGEGDNAFMNEWGVVPSATSSSRPGTANTRNQNSANFGGGGGGGDNSLTFAWQSPTKTSPAKPATQASMSAALRPQPPSMRAITPDQPLASFAALQPSSNQFAQPLQPSPMSSSTVPMRPSSQHQQQQGSNSSLSGRGTSIDWSAATKNVPANPWSSNSSNVQQTQQPANGLGFGVTSKSQQQQQQQQQAKAVGGFSSFGISPPPTSSPQWNSPPLQPLRPLQPSSGGSGGTVGQQSSGVAGGGQKSGLDKYESLI